MTYKIMIEGMGCDHCVRAVTKALEDIGAVAKEVEIGSATAEFAGDKSAITAAIEDVGFDVISIDEA